MNRGHILIVEDEAGLIMALSDRLTNEGYNVESATDGESGFRMARDGSFDMIILDVMLPKKDGTIVCRDLRAARVTTPILMLTARSQVVERVVGLKMGADDYLPKPFEMIELLARIEALLRRAGPGTFIETAESYSFGKFVVDFKRQELRTGDRTIALSTQEYRLLEYLISHRGEVLDRNMLLDAVWGYDAVPTTRTVDVHVALLRQKLSDNEHRRIIVTVHGRGYRFDG